MNPFLLEQLAYEHQRVLLADAAQLRLGRALRGAAQRARWLDWSVAAAGQLRQLVTPARQPVVCVECID